MNGLMLHCGGKAVYREELGAIPIPPETDTYKPIPHLELVKTIDMVANDMLKGMTPHSESLGVSKDGAKLFGVLTYAPEHKDEIGLSIGFRNSLDKSMSVGIALGGSVFVCDNLALSGEVTFLRKHTKGVWASLEDMLISRLYRADKDYGKIVADADTFRKISVSQMDAFMTMGVLYGEDVINTHQLSVMRKEWVEPTHDYFKPRNAWSLYNAATQALKSSPPLLVMKRHTRLHEIMMP